MTVLVDGLIFDRLTRSGRIPSLFHVRLPPPRPAAIGGTGGSCGAGPAPARAAGSRRWRAAWCGRAAGPGGRPRRRRGPGTGQQRQPHAGGRRLGQHEEMLEAGEAGDHRARPRPSEAKYSAQADGPGGVHQEAVVAQIGRRRDRASAQQIEARRTRRPSRSSAASPPPRPAAGAVAQRQVDRVGAEIDQFLRRRQVDLDVRMALVEPRQPRHQPAQGEGRQHAERQDALALRPPQGAGGGGDLRQSVGDPGVIGGAGGRQLDAAADPAEQGVPSSTSSACTARLTAPWVTPQRLSRRGQSSGAARQRRSCGRRSATAGDIHDLSSIDPSLIPRLSGRDSPLRSCRGARGAG